jgi:hypothetical protein
MSFLIPDAAHFLGEKVDDGHCVSFLQTAGNLPPAHRWRRGIKVRGVALAKGTCIATFSVAGRYENRTDGASHAAVLEGEEDVGLAVIDCWVGQPVARRIIRWRDGVGSAANDGDQYYVIEAET